MVRRPPLILWFVFVSQLAQSQTYVPPAVHPLAAEFCKVVTEEYRKQKQIICKSPSVESSSGQGCATVLTELLGDKTITIDSKQLQACRAAIGQMSIENPRGCLKVCLQAIHGHQAKGQKCVTQMECADSQYCHGGTILPDYSSENYGKWKNTYGVCGDALPDSVQCTIGSRNYISGYLGIETDHNFDYVHGDCKNLCDARRRICIPRRGRGEACVESEECGFALNCKFGICAYGFLPKEGDNCEEQKCLPNQGCHGGWCSADMFCDKGHCKRRPSSFCNPPAVPPGLGMSSPNAPAAPNLEVTTPQRSQTPDISH